MTALQRLHGPFQHVHVKGEAHFLDLAALLVAQQLAGAADLLDRLPDAVPKWSIPAARENTFLRLISANNAATGKNYAATRRRKMHSLSSTLTPLDGAEIFALHPREIRVE